MRSLNIDSIYAIAGRRSKFFFRYFLLFSLLIFCILQINIYKICGFSIYPDEFGYWASAAEILGYDWSDTTALGSYYSYGYSLILTPVLWIFHDCVKAYHAAIAVNMLLQCGAAGILWKIYKKLNSSEDLRENRVQTVLAVGIAVFYPPWLFYMQMTMTEALLMFVYTLICYQILLFVENPSITGAVFLSLSLLYIYFVHMRTIAVVIAAVITLILYAWSKPSTRKKLAAVFVVLIAGAVCGLWIKGKIMDTVYAVTDSGLLSVNDYAGHLGTLKYLFTFQGIKEFLYSIAGKLYYLIMASFGLLVPAVCACIKETCKIFRSFFVKPDIRHPENSKGKEYFYFFCLLSMIGQSAITAIVTMSPGRLDGFVYGRYSEHLLPVLMGMGLIAFSETRHKLAVFALSVGISVFTFIVTFKNAMHSGLTVMQGYFAPGISYLSDDQNYDIKTEFWKAFIFGIFLMACVMACIYIGKRFGKNRYMLSIILLIEIMLSLCLGKKYIKPFNDIDYYNLRIAEYMGEYEEPIAYLYGGGFQYIDLIQFAMRDRKVEIIWSEGLENHQKNAVLSDKPEISKLESVLPKEGFLIIDQGCEYLEEIEQRYKKCIESQAFILFMAE